ncbi:MAG: dihydrofolate reductase [Crocinitomicaceae bacterium]|nr:dihydrofolate reductase [Crocinitomicaceae bacterium]
MKVSIIAAMDKNRGIGKNNDLLWHLPNDMRFFKETTQGHVVIMGRKNWDSIPEKYRPLSHRENIVLSRNTQFKADGATVYPNLTSALENIAKWITPEQKIFIIGGAQIYSLAFEECDIDEIFLTEVDAALDADTFFPKFDKTSFSKILVQEQNSDEKHPFAFQIFKWSKH